MSERYECDGCGACCRWPIIEITELDVIREPKLRDVCKPCPVPPGAKFEDDEGESYEPVLPEWACGAVLACSGVCPMLDGNRCSIYPSRPNVCVAFRAGSEQCQEARATEGLPALAPVGETS